MSKQRFLLAIFLLLAFVIFFISPVYSQETVTSKHFEVNLFPEYDQTGNILATFSGIIFNEGNSEVKELSFLLPADTSVDKVAFVRETGELSYLPFNLENKDKQLALKIMLNPVLKPQEKMNLFIQFHFGKLSSAEKKVETNIQFPFTISELSVKILEPPGAGFFKTSLKNELITQTHEGLKLHSFTLNNQRALSFAISYVRNDTTPVVPKEDYQTALNRLQEQAKTQQSSKQKNSNSSSYSSLIVGTIIILMILVIGAVIAFYLVNSKNKNESEVVNKKVLKKMFIEGKITEEEYRKLLKKALEQEG
ncbi:SHOCT domain-containing protein [Carboxydothermus ferrireducens]|uniref:ABC-type glycerol-3-phosphate transport system permease component n=1 Tax=Carboxydothermus ferrireducens DSM 11255 TaxID=1119529 RepID=A0ABX2RAF2_9THEO|nr:hypothetical protein [Carboxydothermus ferrireducens]NYE58158.1 ABC-type glycerol-3-phosphate transport system permease component [Carboxydothermus ferrireducens DSM 11255]